MNAGAGVERFAGLASLVQPCGHVEVALGVDTHPVAATSWREVDQRARSFPAVVTVEVICIDQAIVSCIRVCFDHVQHLVVGRGDNAVGHLDVLPLEHPVQDPSAGLLGAQVELVDGVGISLGRIRVPGSGREEQGARTEQSQVVGGGQGEVVVLVGQYGDFAGGHVGSSDPAGTAFTRQQSPRRIEQQAVGFVAFGTEDGQFFSHRIPSQDLLDWDVGEMDDSPGVDGRAFGEDLPVLDSCFDDHLAEQPTPRQPGILFGDSLGLRICNSQRRAECGCGGVEEGASSDVRGGEGHGKRSDCVTKR